MSNPLSGPVAGHAASSIVKLVLISIAAGACLGAAIYGLISVVF